MTRKQCIKIIEALNAVNALLLVVWHKDSRYPRLWLESWCGAKTSVSIGTAEMILNGIRAGEISPCVRASRTIPKRFRIPSVAGETIETVFVG